MRKAQTQLTTTFNYGNSATRSLPDILTFSHVRWDFVFQRPQHLMSRFANTRRVFFFEEPILHDEPEEPRLEVRRCQKTGVVVVVPQLGRHLSRYAIMTAQKAMLDRFCKERGVIDPISWYYSPELYSYSSHLDTSLVIYDCMDELANFRFASPQLPLLEQNLMRRANLVFTGGRSLYEAKKKLHSQVHCFPSSVDRAHFASARYPALPEPDDQKNLSGPRLGFFGVIDERMDFGLVAAVAKARPEWSIILIGPVAKLRPEELANEPNIHYLGAKSYEQLPQYLAGWDVALMPFAINEATRFISPTKTPEYLAGGKPVVSTPIVDVVRQFGKLKAVGIAQTSASFIKCCDAALALKAETDWLAEADAALAKGSWDNTFRSMNALIDGMEGGRSQVVTTPYRGESTQELENRTGS